MDDVDNVKESHDNTNINFEKDLELSKLKEELKKKFDDYQTTMKFLAADAPIQVLCLPSKIETILLDQGFLRVYDLFNVDFVKIKGLGVARVRDLTACLDQFFSML